MLLSPLPKLPENLPSLHTNNKVLIALSPLPKLPENLKSLHTNSMVLIALSPLPKPPENLPSLQDNKAEWILESALPKPPWKGAFCAFRSVDKNSRLIILTLLQAYFFIFSIIPELIKVIRLIKYPAYSTAANTRLIRTSGITTI